MANRRVVVTGIGALTPLGADLPTFWQNLQAGKSGLPARLRISNQVIILIAKKPENWIPFLNMPLYLPMRLLKMGN